MHLIFLFGLALVFGAVWYLERDVGYAIAAGLAALAAIAAGLAALAAIGVLVGRWGTRAGSRGPWQ